MLIGRLKAICLCYILYAFDVKWARVLNVKIDFARISESVSRTASGLRMFSPVMGQIPPFARVAAITAPVSQVISIEQHCEEKKQLKSKKNSKVNIYLMHEGF